MKKNKPAIGRRKSSKKNSPTPKKKTPSKKQPAKKPRTPRNVPYYPQSERDADLLTTGDLQNQLQIGPEQTEEQKKAQAPRIAARKSAFIKAMVKCMGIATRASVMTGIAARTHRDWLQDDEEYREAIHNVRFVLKDFYEDALIQLVKSKHPAAVIFANKTLNKDRGYYETLHSVNTAMDDNNVTFYIPENDRDESQIQEAQIVNQ